MIADRYLVRVLSLQFDPAPRAGEPLVSRRVPDVGSSVLAHFIVSTVERS